MKQYSKCQKKNNSIDKHIRIFSGLEGKQHIKWGWVFRQYCDMMYVLLDG